MTLQHCLFLQAVSSRDVLVDNLPPVQMLKGLQKLQAKADDLMRGKACLVAQKPLLQIPMAHVWVDEHGRGAVLRTS